MPIVIIVLLTAIAISAVAAYFSIVGLAALFAATATGVIIMAATLEVGKVVTTKLIHTLWRSKRATWLLKGPLMMMVASLMCVTSLGIYGYLSKGHLEQNAPMAGIDIQSEGLQRQIDQKNNENKQLQTRLDQINANINAFLTSGAATKGLAASKQLKTERDQIQKQLDDNNQQINGLSDKLVPLKTQASEVQAKLGPVKYVAALFGFQDPEVAVRIVILLIMVAFDPLAICLVIAASVAYDDYKDKKAEPNEPNEPNEPETKLARTSFDEVAPEVDDQDELNRLSELNQTLQNEVAAFKEELARAQEQIAKEKEEIDEAKAAYQAKEADLEEIQQEVLSYLDDKDSTTKALAAYEADLATKHTELEQREKDLADRIALLEKFFPAGTTDDQAIVALLEKNPKILEDIVEIIEQTKRKDSDGGPTMIIRS